MSPPITWADSVSAQAMGHTAYTVPLVWLLQGRLFSALPLSVRPNPISAGTREGGFTGPTPPPLVPPGDS